MLITVSPIKDIVSKFGGTDRVAGLDSKIGHHYARLNIRSKTCDSGFRACRILKDLVSKCQIVLVKAHHTVYTNFPL